MGSLWYDKNEIKGREKSARDITHQTACFMRFASSAIMGGLNPYIICRSRLDHYISLTSIPGITEGTKTATKAVRASMRSIMNEFEGLKEDEEYTFPTELTRWIGSGNLPKVIKSRLEIRRTGYIKKTYDDEDIRELIKTRRDLKAKEDKEAEEAKAKEAMETSEKGESKRRSSTRKDTTKRTPETTAPPSPAGSRGGKRIKSANDLTFKDGDTASKKDSDESQDV